MFISLWSLTLLFLMFYRQNLYLKYAQQFQTLFREWDINMQKAQEQEEKLAVNSQCIKLFNTGARVIEGLLAQYTDEVAQGDIPKTKAKAIWYKRFTNVAKYAPLSLMIRV